MLTYNTRLKKLVLPEYGRNIQRMVDHCLTIDDRDERTRCAYTIVAAMSTLFPEFRNNEESMRKLWDHLVIMSDFQLDVDFPYDVVKAESLQSKPEPIERATSRIGLFHYGRFMEQMIDRASRMEPGEERDALVELLCNQMKKLMLAVNKDGVDDSKIFADIERISEGRIRIAPDTIVLHEFKEAPQPGKKKKKK